jgi:hypothetical protein
MHSHDDMMETDDVSQSAEWTAPFGLSRTAFTLLVVFGSMFAFNFFSFLWDYSALYWPHTMGRVGDVQELPSPKAFAPGRRVSYTYTVDAQMYSDNTYITPGLATQTPDRQFISGQQLPVFYSPLSPTFSTVAPADKCKLDAVYSAFPALACLLVLLGRSRLTVGKVVREQMPDYLDCVATLLEQGVSPPAALEQASKTCAARCPQLCQQVDACVLRFKVERVPIHQSLREVGINYRVDALTALAAALAGAEMSHSSVAYQVREQSKALKHTLRAKNIAAENAVAGIGAHKFGPGSRSITYRRNGLSPEEILEKLDQD